jgi:hypothetical protein
MQIVERLWLRPISVCHRRASTRGLRETFGRQRVRPFHGRRGQSYQKREFAPIGFFLYPGGVFALRARLGAGYLWHRLVEGEVFESDRSLRPLWPAAFLTVGPAPRLIAGDQAFFFFGRILSMMWSIT